MCEPPRLSRRLGFLSQVAFACAEKTMCLFFSFLYFRLDLPFYLEERLNLLSIQRKETIK